MSNSQNTIASKDAGLNDKKAKAKGLGILLYVASLILICSLLISNLRLFITSGPSMEPTYTEGTWVLGIRLHDKDLMPGDLVFLQFRNVYCLKRVAFTEGQDVSQAGYEGYWGSNIVPEGYVYVLGDNPDHSIDSRSSEFGLVARENIQWTPIIHRAAPTP